MMLVKNIIRLVIASTVLGPIIVYFKMSGKPDAVHYTTTVNERNSNADTSQINPGSNPHPQTNIIEKVASETSFISESIYPDCQSLSEDQFWNIVNRRKAHISETCKLYRNRNYRFHWEVHWDDYGNHFTGNWYDELQVFDKLRLIYQGIQKTGTINVKAYFNQFGEGFRNYSSGETKGEENVHFNGTARFRNMYPIRFIKSIEEAKHKFESYYKIVFFREPLERLMSAYSFFAGPNSTLLSYPDTLQMLREARKLNYNPVKKDILSGKLQHLTVSEFLRAILKTNDSASLNKHWRPQMVNGMPCEIPYDFIGSTKDMSCEMTFLMKKLTGEYQHSSIPSPAKSADDKTKALLSGVQPDLIMDVLLKHFKIDYDFLRYPLIPVSTLSQL